MRSRLLCLCTVVLLALVAAACGNADSEGASTPADSSSTDSDQPSDPAAGDRNTFVEISGVPGVSDDAITFAAIGTQANNPLGTCVLDCFKLGIQAYFDFRNAEGGIYGRDLVLGDVLDDELANNQARALEVISGGDAFGVFVATQIASGYQDLDDNGVPTFGWNIHSTEAAGRDAIFPSGAVNCVNCPGRGVPFLVQQTGATKVATLGYGVSENSKVCTQTTRDSIERHSDDIGGAEVAYFNDDLAFGLPNGIAPEVTEMKNAGVDFIATCMDLNGMQTLGQELKKQGIVDQVTMYHPNTYDQDFVAANAEIFDGDYVGVGFVPFEAETDNALVDAFLTQMAENGNDPSELAMVGFINADEAFTGLLEAGPDFDRPKVIDGLNSLTAYDAGGILNPIDWTRQHNPRTPDDPTNGYKKECIAVVQIVDGAFEVVADPATPWFCWDNSTPEFSEPEQVAFG